MIGRTPGNIVAVRPLQKGRDLRLYRDREDVKILHRQGCGQKNLKKAQDQRSASPAEPQRLRRKAVEDATYQAGAREVCIIEEPVAAAIGAGIDISKACGNMIVDIGGGTADIAVISLGGTVVSTSIKTGRRRFR